MVDIRQIYPWERQKKCMRCTWELPDIYQINAWDVSEKCLRYQLLLTQFWPNFKNRYLGTSRTGSSCHVDICPCNISPGDIFPYQQYKCFQAAHFRQQSCLCKFSLKCLSNGSFTHSINNVHRIVTMNTHTNVHLNVHIHLHMNVLMNFICMPI